MLDFSDCLLLDGGMGTMLQRAGLEPGQAPEKLNLTAPEAVEAVHRAYAAAGADILTANTFGASRWKLGEDPAINGAFLDEIVMEEILSELKDIARRGGISCTCGSRRWGFDVNFSSVDLYCQDCGGRYRIPAATADDIDDLCCKTSILIRGKEK